MGKCGNAAIRPPLDGMQQTRVPRAPVETASVLGWDPDHSRRNVLSSALSTAGIAVRWLQTPTLSGRAPDTEPLACVLLDKPHGAATQAAPFELMQELAAAGFRIAAYAEHSTDWDIGTRCDCVVNGATALHDCMDSSFADGIVRQMRDWLAEIERKRRLDIEDAGLMRSLGIAGRSAAIRNVMATVRRVVQLHDLPVLISGESGTGKELVARAIHQLDPKRRNAPLIAVNCAAIPQHLAEDELFGHVRGSFTGASRDKRGLLRAASGGVLFLDEIGDLGGDVQGKLLRVIQEQAVRPLGTDRDERVDVRIVAATHRNLVDLVHRDRFREDLYYRLSVLPVCMPTLRERADDIPLLVDHFLERYSALHGVPRLSATPAFHDALRRCPLPGNVRQLENVIRQSIAFRSGDGLLDLNDLPVDVLRSLAGRDAASSEGRPQAACGVAAAADPASVEQSLQQMFMEQGWNLTRSLRFCERTLITTALRRSHGNQAATARLLGITPRSVYNKLRRHHVL
jgi:DNA-binding NtrC family response regulator